MQKVPEILAPAGGRAQFFAALNAGADAVYLGLKAFNARARAENFTTEDLRELVPLARRYGMKVLVTVNVLIKEAELGPLVETLSTLEELDVHAIIVQDLAVARVARRHFPGLRLHASTQMAVHNLAGVREAARHGFRRVVLARELTALEVKRIRAAIPESEMELEAFCHGSLCYSYSGLCFFSGANDARSGNRGECAYTCRQPYKILNEPGHGFLFSMRDLDSSDDLGVLVGTGVDTLKIEGRKKDAQYVASVVKLYRNRLDALFGRPTLRPQAPGEAHAPTSEKSAREDLSLSFQRNPTTFFLKGRYYENVIDLDNPTHLGIRVGTISRVGGGAVQVVAETPLERFDGLRAASGGQVFHSLVKKFNNEGPQFSIREMRVDGKWAPVAARGARVEIAWPDDSAPPQKGDVLYKVRSADLKRRVHKLESPPPDARLRPLSVVDIDVAAVPDAETLRIHATVSKLGETLTEAEIAVPLVASRGGSHLAKDAADALALFGDQQIVAGELAIDAEAAKWFVPRAKLKELKHALARGLVESYAACVARRREAATADVLRPRARPPVSPEERLAVKLDRLETLDDLRVILAESPELGVSEVVFEPKRAFLPALNPETLTDALLAFREATGVPVRLAFPMVIRAWDEPLLQRWMTHATRAGLSRFEVGNLGALELMREWGLETTTPDIAADFTLYALNSQASRFWAERGLRSVALSVEDDLANLTRHLERWPWETGLRPQAILFKDTPLFIAEACSLTALHNGCPTAKVCGYRTLEIESPAGERYYVAHESCKSIVYAKEAYSITHASRALYDLGVRDFRVDFLTRPYPRERLGAVLRAAAGSERLPATHVNNFERTLL